MTQNNQLELFIRLSSANNHISKRLDRTLGALHGLGVSEFRVLHQLELALGNTLSRIELADSVGLTASGITRLLNPMEKIGLVVKLQNKRDARVSLVSLSKAGKLRFTQALDGFNEVMKDCLKNLDKKEQKALFTLLGKIN